MQRLLLNKEGSRFPKLDNVVFIAPESINEPQHYNCIPSLCPGAMMSIPISPSKLRALISTYSFDIEINRFIRFYTFVITLPARLQVAKPDSVEISATTSVHTKNSTS